MGNEYCENWEPVEFRGHFQNLILNLSCIKNEISTMKLRFSWNQNEGIYGQTVIAAAGGAIRLAAKMNTKNEALAARIEELEKENTEQRYQLEALRMEIEEPKELEALRQTNCLKNSLIEDLQTQNNKAEERILIFERIVSKYKEEIRLEAFKDERIGEKKIRPKCSGGELCTFEYKGECYNNRSGNNCTRQVKGGN